MSSAKMMPSRTIKVSTVFSIFLILLTLVISLSSTEGALELDSTIDYSIIAEEQQSESTITSATGTIAINFNATNVFWRSWQQKTFHAKGLFWAFYGNGTYEVYSTSKDGYNWAVPTLADVHSINAISCSVWYDGQSTVYNIVAGSYNTALFFKTGTLNSDGTVTWSTDITVLSEPSTDYLYPYISVDSNGYPWISYCKMTGGLAYPYVVKSSLNTTWRTAVGFPYQLSSTSTTVYYGQIILPLTNGKMFAFYVDTMIGCCEDTHNTYGQAQAWNGSAWLPPTNTSAILGGEMQGGWEWGLVPQNDCVNLVYLTNTTNYIAYEKYTYESNSFGSEQIISDKRVQAYTVPMIALDAATGRLYTVWGSTFEPSTADPWFYYSVYSNGVWSARQIFVNDSSYCSFVSPYAASLSINTFDGCLCMLYVNGTAANFHDSMPVRFVYMDISNVTSLNNVLVSPKAESGLSEALALLNQNWLFIFIVVIILIVAAVVIVRGKTVNSSQISKIEK